MAKKKEKKVSEKKVMKQVAELATDHEVIMDSSEAVPELEFILDHGVMLPERGTEKASCYDLIATELSTFNDEVGEQFLEYRFGIRTNIPEGYEVQVYPLSRNTKKSIYMVNSPAIIDEDYTGYWKIRFKLKKKLTPIEIIKATAGKRVEGIYRVGEPVAQYVLKEKLVWKQSIVDEVKETKRGDGAFGHTLSKLEAQDAKED